MQKRSQSVLILVSFVALVFILRSSHTSPATLLRQQFVRALQQAKPSETLCKGIDLNKNYTQAQIDRAEGYRNSLSKLRSGNPLIDFIEGPQPESKFGSDYIVKLYPFATPWVVFFVIGLITLFVFLTNWCCTYCSFCRLCECCTHPKQRRLRTCYIVSSIIFMTAIIAAGIVGIIVSRNISENGRRTVCDVALFVETVADGSVQDNWVGIAPAAQKLLDVLDNFNSTVERLQETNNSFVQINSQLTAATDAVTAMYNNNSNDFVATPPNPQDSGSYQPTYVQQLGPPSSAKTATGSIQLEMEIKKYLVANASTAIDAAVRELKSNQSVIGSNILKGRNLANQVLGSVSNVLATVQKFGNQADSIISAVNGGLLGVFIANMIVAALALTSIFLVFCGAKAFNKVLHLTWCALALLMLLGFVLSTIALPLSLFLSEGCEAVDKVIVSPPFFNETYDKFIGASSSNSQQAKNTLYRCLYGNGDILSQLQIQGALNQFNQIFTFLNDTSNLTEYVQKVPDSLTIPINQALISEFQTGLVPDAPITVQDLIKLNAYTNKNSNQCTRVTDTWVLNSANCTSSFGTVFTAGDAADFNLNNPTCIGFDAWGTKDISARYNTAAFPLASCGTISGEPAFQYLQDFVNQFVQSRIQVNAVFGQLTSSLNTVAARNSEFMASVKAITNTFVPIINTTRTIYNALEDPNDGLLTNANCTFIKESLVDIRDSMCIGFTSGVFQTTIVMIIISFMSYFGMFSLFCLSKKFLTPKKAPAAQKYTTA